MKTIITTLLLITLYATPAGAFTSKAGGTSEEASTTVIVTEADAACKNFNYDLAIHKYSEAVKRAATAEVYLKLGNAWMQKGDQSTGNDQNVAYEQAKTAAEMALGYNDKEARAW